jgi:hypothetical protein
MTKRKMHFAATLFNDTACDRVAVAEYTTDDADAVTCQLCKRTEMFAHALDEKRAAKRKRLLDALKEYTTTKLDVYVENALTFLVTLYNEDGEAENVVAVHNAEDVRHAEHVALAFFVRDELEQHIEYELSDELLASATLDDELINVRERLVMQLNENEIEVGIEEVRRIDAHSFTHN